MDKETIINPKRMQYEKLVSLRQDCSECPNLVNQHQVDGGIYDSPHIGAWSRWQGNLNAPLLLVGQDWGTVSVFRQFRGIDPPLLPQHRTNLNLMDLMKVAGYHIEPPGQDQEGQVFFTNAVLCLKTDNSMQASVPEEYFDRCGRKFLRPLIEIVHPKVVVALGQYPYAAVRRAFEPNFRIQPPFRRYVGGTPALLPGGPFFSLFITVGQEGQTETARSRSNARIGSASEISWQNRGRALLEEAEKNTKKLCLPG